MSSLSPDHLRRPAQSPRVTVGPSAEALWATPVRVVANVPSARLHSAATTESRSRGTSITRACSRRFPDAAGAGSSCRPSSPTSRGGLMQPADPMEYRRASHPLTPAVRTDLDQLLSAAAPSLRHRRWQPSAGGASPSSGRSLGVRWPPRTRHASASSLQRRASPRTPSDQGLTRRSARAAPARSPTRQGKLACVDPVSLAIAVAAPGRRGSTTESRRPAIRAADSAAAAATASDLILARTATDQCHPAMPGRWAAEQHQRPSCAMMHGHPGVQRRWRQLRTPHGSMAPRLPSGPLPGHRSPQRGRGLMCYA